MSPSLKQRILENEEPGGGGGGTTTGTLGDIQKILRHPSHYASRSHSSQLHNSSTVPLPPIPTIEYSDDSSGLTLEEEVDHVLISLTLVLPFIIGFFFIAGIALLVRKMRRAESIRDEMSDRSFSSLPTAAAYNEEISTVSKLYHHSISMPHLLLIDTTKHSVSLPHLLAIETYYNYPSAASILDETYQDCVDETKIQAESQSSSPTVVHKKRRTLKRSLSIKSLRRLRSRILHILRFKKRRERQENNRQNPNTFDLVNLSGETREQLKQIYVY